MFRATGSLFSSSPVIVVEIVAVSEMVSKEPFTMICSSTLATSMPTLVGLVWATLTRTCTTVVLKSLSSKLIS